jgi:AcrR family transcriptional regulator
MPRAFTEEERDRIQGRLIKAGKIFINRAGIKLLVVDDIAREAGISKGSFYSFYPSREDFILSVFESWEDEYRNTLLTRATEGEGGPRKRLERFFTSAFALLEREPGLARMGTSEIEMLMEKLPRERILAHQERDKLALDSAMKAWIEDGLVREEDVPALGGVMSSIFAIAIRRGDFPEGSYVPAVELIAEALAMRLAGEGGDDGRE